MQLFIINCLLLSIASFTNHALNGIGDVHQSALKMNWEDRIMQATKACEAWRSEADDSNRKVGVEAFDDDAAAQYSMYFPPPVGVRLHSSTTANTTTTSTTSSTSATQAALAEQQRDSGHVQLVTEKLCQLGGGGGSAVDHLNGVGGAAMPRELRIQGLKGLQVSATVHYLLNRASKTYCTCFFDTNLHIDFICCHI